MHKKIITWKEFKEQFGGLNRLRFEWQETGIKYGKGMMMPFNYNAELAYNKKKDCTYIGLVCLGFIPGFGISDSEEVIVIKADGKVRFNTAEDMDPYVPYLEELEMHYKKKLDENKSSKEEES